MQFRTLAPALAQRAGRRAAPRHRSARRHQRGATIITVALALLFLLGFMGIAIDFGRLFVVKTELQTAVDSCALAAAAELDGGPDALARARSAGLTVGNLNKVHFQSGTAGIQASDTDGSIDDILFSDQLAGSYSATFPVATAKYAKCEHARTGLAPWLLQAMTAFTGNGKFSEDLSVAAVAVATRAPAQTVCALPIQIRPRNSTGPDYGLRPGEWLSVLYDPNRKEEEALGPGQFGWANLGDKGSAQQTDEELLGSGVCDLPTSLTQLTHGKEAGSSKAWNTRFGLYTGNLTADDGVPDMTGYSYYPARDALSDKNDPNGKWKRSTYDDLNPALGNFLLNRSLFTSFGGQLDTLEAGEEISGVKFSGNYKNKDMAHHRDLMAKGANRRLALAPITNGSLMIMDWACILMLHPISISEQMTVYIEYVGNAAAQNSACSSLGLAGGDVGPLVPVLVQ